MNKRSSFEQMQPRASWIVAAVALISAVVSPFATADNCAQHNPVYDFSTLVDHVNVHYIDDCLPYPNSTCIDCIADVAGGEPEDSYDIYHCAEDVEGTTGTCRRYESVEDLNHIKNLTL